MNYYYVYIYYDSNGIPRYVGKGKGKRDTSHEKNCQKKNHCEYDSFFHRWLRYQQDHDISYTCVRVAEDFTEQDAHELEITYVARFGRQNDEGAGPLTNLTDGGEGASGRIVSEEEKQRRAEISSAAWASMTQEERDRHRNAVAAGRLAQLAALTEEERKHRTEVRSAAHLAMWAALSQEGKERHREACSRASAATWASLTPEEKQRRSEALSAGYAAQTPEEKRAWSEALSGAQAAVWAAMTPEERQRRGEAISAATTAAWASLTQEEKKRRAEVISRVALARWAAMTTEKNQQLSASYSKAGLARWAKVTPEGKQRHGEAAAAGKASKVLGFKATFHQIRRGYQSLTGRKMILTRKHTCPKAAQELIDTYGRERVRVVLACIPAKPVTEQTEAA